MYGAKEQQETTKTSRLFQEMERMHRTWMKFRPPGALSRSGLALLILIRRMEEDGHAPVTVGRLARMVHQSAPSVSQKIRALETLGYVERSGDPDDRRVCFVLLTPAGREEAAAQFQRIHSSIGRALDALGEERSELLLCLMREMNDAVRREILGPAEETEETARCR